MSFCRSCNRTLAEVAERSLPICQECWNQMTPAERCARWEARDLAIFTTGQDLLAQAIADSIAQQTEMCNRMARTEQAMHIAAQAANSINKTLAECIEKAEHDGDGWLEELMKKRRNN